MKNTRRTFLKNISVTSLTATLLPASVLDPDAKDKPLESVDEIAMEQSTREFNGTYTGEFLNRVAFPLGGMGAGMFCVEGNGAISHMSVRHKPDVFNEPGMFGAIHIKGIDNGSKILEGPAPDWKKFGMANAGNGSGGTVFGLPRFDEAQFISKFPFATISLKDEELPLQVEIEAWSPFIPGDADNSSLPVAGLRYRFINNGSQSLSCVFSFHSKNFFKDEKEKVRNSVGSIKNGFVLQHDGSEEKPFLKADFALFTDQPNTVVNHCWFRGFWFDAITMTWQSIVNGEIKSVEPVDADAPGGSLYVPFDVAPGQNKDIQLQCAWYVPSSDLRFGDNVEGDPDCNPESGCCNTTEALGEKIADPEYAKGNYKPWYSSKFSNIQMVSEYWTTEYQGLHQKSKQFSDTFYSSTLPKEVVEAIAANLTILKSPTVLRQFDGRLWNFEGCGDSWGCCHGSCTHVWNYAQAIPHLFPKLERTLRHTEFCENQNKEGHQTFRASLPIKPLKHDFHAAADGQLGGIMKVYREWRVSGDDAWLKKMYPLVKVSLDYCQRAWDPKLKGIIEEPHHNTYDIEFWGPDGMCTSFYLGALSAIMEMSKFLKKNKDVAHYRKIYETGKAFLENELYNGEYFIQKIQTKGLSVDPLEAAKKSMVGNYSAEAQKLFEKEGPKYQYGIGCLSDGVLGAWIARMCGLNHPFDDAKISAHLKSVHRYNFKKNLKDHANPQRPSFAFGNEGGLLLCSWPKGGKLSLPFVYSDEVWTGIEYQVASHLMLCGNVEEGLEIVRACRQRYDGRVRNPFNEYECGHWYARALSSYGLMQGLTGVRFDAVSKTLYVDSKIGDFTSFLSTETGYGTVTLADNKASVNVVSGTIPVSKIYISGKLVK